MPVLPLVGSTIVEVPGHQIPALFRGLDHGEADAILHAVAGIGRFELPEDRRVQSPATRLSRTRGVPTDQAR